MDQTDKAKLREFLRKSLEEAGDRAEFADDSSLFASGRLDSLAMTRLVLFLEENFDINFGDVDFDVDLLESVHAIETFLDVETARRV